MIYPIFILFNWIWYDLFMDVHEIFDETYELFVEEISHRIQYIYASKFYEGIRN